MGTQKIPAKPPLLLRKDLKGKARRLLLGVTGGVASGKTTVSGMLAELGAVAIDFDGLARQVVLPGRPAWREIVRRFGKQVLNPDGTLNRKELSGLVFADAAQRELLQDITHPYIFQEFYRQVARIKKDKAPKIIQAVVPLLYELNLPSMFDKVLLVYITPAEQVRRLMKRDKIKKEEARRILAAQLPIEDKVRWADFVIDNSGTRAQTRSQVQDLWETLPVRQGRK